MVIREPLTNAFYQLVYSITFNLIINSIMVTAIFMSYPMKRTLFASVEKNGSHYFQIMIYVLRP